MTENEIKFASNYIATIALEDNGAEKVNIAIQSLLSTYLKEASLNVQKNEDFKPLSTIITFTQKEISHIGDKDREQLFKLLKDTEKKIPQLERYKEYVDFIQTHAPDKLIEAKRTATERSRMPKPPKTKNYQWTK